LLIKNRSFIRNKN